MRMTTLASVVWAAVVVLALAAHAAWHDSVMPKRTVKLGEFCLPLTSGVWRHDRRRNKRYSFIPSDGGMCCVCGVEVERKRGRGGWMVRQ